MFASEQNNVHRALVLLLLYLSSIRVLYRLRSPYTYVCYLSCSPHRWFVADDALVPLFNTNSAIERYCTVRRVRACTYEKKKECSCFLKPSDFCFNYWILSSIQRFEILQQLQNKTSATMIAFCS